MLRESRYALATLALCARIEVASADVPIEPMGKAIEAALGTKQAFQKKAKVDGKDVTLFYSKDSSGKPAKLAFVEKGLFPPNCTHTWVIGVGAGDQKITAIRVTEMKCPHAFPGRRESFLEQYMGKGPADLKGLKKEVNTIAQATATCDLTTDAVIRSVTAAAKLKGQL